tara:strand:- start:2898 stop:4202 length:1305 start_codon:yes stop_codon:yes gene_type:complete
MPKILPKCRDNYILNKETCSCKKEEIKAETKTKLKCTLKKMRECAKKNKICNDKTGRCINPPKTKKKKKTKKIKNKTLKLVLKNKKSFSPEINQRLKMMEPLTPEKDIFDTLECGEFKIPVKTKSGTRKCYNWNSKKVKDVLLKNLNTTRIVPENIVAPKQVNSNCWFNSFFMAFFISDKGRKFFRHFRKLMIEGKTFSGKKIPAKAAKPLWLLNRYINASIIGREDPSVFALNMDTNNIIRGLYPHLKKTKTNKDIRKLGLRKGNAVKTKKAGNPVDYYLRILHFLGESNLKIVNLNFSTLNMAKNALINYIERNNPAPEVVWIHQHKEKNQKQTFKKSFKVKNITYVMDSVVLISTNEAHFSAYITLNKKDYMFDGERYKDFGKEIPFNNTLTEFKWKSKLLKKTKWKPEPTHEEEFTFNEKYRIYFYYRQS